MKGLAAFPAHPVSLSAAAGEALAEGRWPGPGDHGAGTAEALRTSTACPLPPCQGTQPQTSPQAALGAGEGTAALWPRFRLVFPAKGVTCRLPLRGIPRSAARLPAGRGCAAVCHEGTGRWLCKHSVSSHCSWKRRRDPLGLDMSAGYEQLVPSEASVWPSMPPASVGASHSRTRAERCPQGLSTGCCYLAPGCVPLLSLRKHHLG